MAIIRLFNLENTDELPKVTVKSVERAWKKKRKYAVMHSR